MEGVPEDTRPYRLSYLRIPSSCRLRSAAHNPLEEITNTTTIEAVVLNGSYLDRAALDGILSAVREANDQSRTVALD